MDTKSTVYSRNVVEFATVAKEYCAFLENLGTHTRKTFIGAMHKLLPLLYYKASVLHQIEPLYDESNEHWVTEDQYAAISAKLKALLGQYDDFLDFNPSSSNSTEEHFSASISEFLTDIYQDLKNFTMLYYNGNVDVMSDALWECYENFQDFWGVRLLSSLKELHVLYYSDTDLDAADWESQSEESVKDTSSWFITQRQEDMRK